MEAEALGLKVSGVDGIDRATKSLNDLSSAANNAQDSAKGLSDSTKTASDSSKTLAGSAAGGAKASDALAAASKKAKQATDELGNSSESTSGKVGALGKSAYAAGVAIGAAFSINALRNYADTWSDLQSQVGAATGDMSGAAAQMTRLVDIANASYSSVQQTVQGYAANASTLRDLGKSSAEAADYTESLNHMLVLTATRGERASSVQNALSKAMAVGKLQADGLETVLANGGEVAQALAKELGTTVSGLRGLASEGKITGEVIANAIIKPLDDVRERAAEMPATIGDAFTRVNNNITEFVGTLDKATGTSSAIADLILSFADGIRTAGQYIIAFGQNAAPVFTFMGKAFDTISEYADIALAAVAWFFAPVVLAGVASLTASLAVGLVGAIKAVTVVLMANPIGLIVAGITAAAYAVYKFRDDIANVFGVDVIGLVKSTANYIIASFVAAYEAISTYWSNIGNVLGAAMVGAANAVIRSINWMVSKSLEQFNTLISALNSIPVLNLDIALIDTGPALQELANTYADALGGAVDSAGKKISEAFSKDYVTAAGTWVKGMFTTQKAAESAANNGVKPLALATNGLSNATKDANKETEERNKLMEQFAKSQESANAAAYKNLEAIKQQVERQKEANASIGLTKDALAALEVAKIRDEAASARRMAAQIYQADGDTKEAAAYREMANELERLAMLKEQGAMRQANVDAQNEIANEWDKTSKTIGDTLQDYIMGGGKNAAQYLKRLFSTLVLQPIVNVGVQGIMGLFGGNRGRQGAAGAGGGSFIDQLSNSGGGFTNWGSWGSTAGGTISGWGGSLVNSGFDTVGQGLVNLGSTIGELDLWLQNIPGFSGGIGSALGYLGSLTQLLQGNYGSAIGSGIGTFLLPGLGTMIGGFLGGLFDWQSTPHVGATGYYTTQGGSQNFNAGETKYNAEIGAMVEGLAATVGNSFEMFLESFGLSGNVAVTTNWADDFNGKGNSWGYFAMAMQDAFGEWTDLVDWRANNGPEVRQYAEGEAGYAEYVADVYRSLIDGLQQADIPAWASSVLDQVGDSASIEEINAVLLQLGVMREALSSWQENLVEFANVGDDTFGALLDAMGGFSNLSSGVASFIDLYYSDAEKLEIAQNQLQKQLDEYDIKLPMLDMSDETMNTADKVKAAWRSMVEEALASGEDGAKLAAILLQLGPAFASATDAAEAATQKEKDLADQRIAEQQRVIDELYSSAGISGSTIAQILRDSMLGRISGDDAGGQLADHIMAGIENSMANGFANQITAMMTDGIITPLLQAAATGSALSGVVSQASMNATIEAARRSMAAMNAILNDPEIQKFLADLRATVSGTTTNKPLPNANGPVIGGTPTAPEPGKVTTPSGNAVIGGTVTGSSVSEGSIWYKQTPKSSSIASDAQAIINAWKSVYDAILGTMTNLRDEILGVSEDGGNSFYEAQFALLTAQARAGDQDAAAKLPDIVSKLVGYAKETSESRYDQNSAITGYINSLDETNKYVAGLYRKAGGDVSKLDTYVSGGVNQSTAVTPISVNGSSYVPVNTPQVISSTIGVGETQSLAELRAIKSILTSYDVKIEAVRLNTQNTSDNTQSIDRTIRDVTNGGEAMVVEFVS